MSQKSSFSLNMDSDFWNSILFRLNLKDPIIKSQFLRLFETMLQDMTNHFIQDSDSYHLTIKKNNIIISKHELSRKEDMYSLILNGISENFTSFVSKLHIICNESLDSIYKCCKIPAMATQPFFRFFLKNLNDTMLSMNIID